MNPTNRTTIIAVIIALGSLGLAIAMRPVELPAVAYEDTGDALFPSFNDPAQASSLEVTGWDDTGARVTNFKVEQKAGRWVIPSHNDYPADGTERMGSPNPGYWGRVSVLVETARACEAMPVVGAEFTVGRERGDLTFPTDGYVSSSHCRIVGDDSGVYLEDRGSSNGTYLRVRSGTVVPFGSLVLIGQQLFHVRQA